MVYIKYNQLERVRSRKRQILVLGKCVFTRETEEVEDLFLDALELLSQVIPNFFIAVIPDSVLRGARRYSDFKVTHYQHFRANALCDF